MLMPERLRKPIGDPDEVKKRMQKAANQAKQRQKSGGCGCKKKAKN
jgi:hypothetical protein